MEYLDWAATGAVEAIHLPGAHTIINQVTQVYFA